MKQSLNIKAAKTSGNGHALSIASDKGMPTPSKFMQFAGAKDAKTESIAMTGG